MPPRKLAATSGLYQRGQRARRFDEQRHRRMTCAERSGEHFGSRTHSWIMRLRSWAVYMRQGLAASRLADETRALRCHEIVFR